MTRRMTGTQRCPWPGGAHGHGFPAGGTALAASEPMDLLGLTPFVDDTATFELTAPLVRFDGQLYGGTGLAATIAAMQTVTDRRAVWATTQFVGTATEGEHVTVSATELAHGGTTSQVAVTGTIDDRVLFTGLGSTARTRDGGFEATFGTMPKVDDPEDCGPLTFGGMEVPEEMTKRGPFTRGVFRVAPGEHDSRYVWANLEGIGTDGAAMGYVADFIPSAVLNAVGRLGGGTSLDNSIRFGPPVPEGTGWILLDSDPYFGDNGFVHGAARLWARDGTLVAVASQSAVARVFG